MKTMIKKVFSIVFALIAALGLLSFTASAASHSIVGTWQMGSGTKEIRKILSGNYGDIKRITFVGQGASYTFNGDGTYRYLLASGLKQGNVLSGIMVTVIEGTYSLSDGMLTLSNGMAQNTKSRDIPIKWETIATPSSETHNIAFGVSPWGSDCFTVESNGVVFEKGE